MQNKWDVKSSMGNGEAKELVFMTHGQELKGVFAEGKGVQAEEGKGGKTRTTVIA